MRGGEKMNEFEESKFNIQNILIGAGVILVIIAGYFYFKAQKPEEEVVPPAEEIIIQEEGLVKKTGEIIEPLTEEELVVLKEEVDGVLSTAGEEVELVDVVGGGVAGHAKRAFSDGKFYFKVEVSGLEPVEKGYYYEGWLKNEDGVVSVGRVELSQTGQGSLYYTASADRSEYSGVVITLEPEDGNPEPATHVLEGEF